MGPKDELDLQEMLSQLGEFGPYQLKQHILHCLSWLLFAIHMMSFVFVFPVAEHRCYVNEVDGYHYDNINITSEMQLYIPRNKGKFESCLKYDNYNGSVGPCEDGYVYSNSTFASSRVADWNMVCDRSWMRALLQSIFLLGTLVGSFVCGSLADKFGRKPVFCVSGILQLFFGVAGAFLNNYYIYAFSIFWYGLFGGSGTVVSSVALTVELVGASKRSTCSTMFTVWFGLGGIVVAAWAYFLPISAKILQIIFAMHSLLLFGHFWLMDESICFLWTNGQRGRAIEIFKKAMKFNGKEVQVHIALENTKKPKVIPTLEIIPENNDKCKDNEKPTNENEKCAAKETKADKSSPSAWDLLRYPKLRQRTLVMMFCWFATNLQYFGLSFNSVNLVGNPYLMFVLSIVSEFPGHLISIFLTSKIGYKLMLFTSIFVTGVCCIAVPLLPAGVGQICITMMAKVAATVAINVIHVYTAELFPTSHRNTALGSCIMVARLGAAMIPQLNLLGTMAEEIPIITFGVAGIISSALILCLLPETMNRKIPQTVADVENPKDEKIKVNVDSEGCKKSDEPNKILP